MRRLNFAHALAFCALLTPVFAQSDTMQEAVKGLIDAHQEKADKENLYDGLFVPGTKILTVKEGEKFLTLTFNEQLGRRSWTPAQAEELKSALATSIGATKPLEILVNYADGPGKGGTTYSLDEHITDPAGVQARASSRKEGAGERPLHPVVQRPDYKGTAITRGLVGHNFVMGPSHGMTWHEENRWQFQRARLWTIIEDLYPISYINPFVAPMLENAGANVFSVRERDWQTAEVIVDYAEADPDSYTSTVGSWRTIGGAGWHGGVPTALGEQDEPFRVGTTAQAEVDPAAPAAVSFVPDIPRMGRYAVYASWRQSPRNSPSVPIRISHLGGTTTVRVNQQVAGGTWVLLGFYEFDPGANSAKGSVTITTDGAELSPRAVRREDGESVTIPTTVSIDAIRFGGGLGNAAPEGITSQLPRWGEAARYFLQYAGAPRDTVFLQNASIGHFGIDYNRDISARGEWPNYLTAELGVPIDAFLAFHTDAGTDKQGVIGTLMLHRIWDNENSDKFPDGRSRLLSRDLGAMMQDEIIRSARGLYSSTWAKRTLEDRGFGEVRRPKVPSVILELLSHQNFNDMKYGLDPRFKFDMSRAIYKSLVRFVAWQEGREPVIQPLAPVRFRTRQDGQGGAVLTWEPQDDPLEASATPTGYVLYSSRDGRSFDNGTFVANSSVALSELPEGELLAFRVTAVNEGGESFPSPTLAMRWKKGLVPFLQVDGFDRVSGPAIVEQGGIRGFDRHVDPGVPWMANYGLVGDVYDFDEASEWKNDLESTGWGASDSLMEGHLEKGNTFDHSVTHGRVLAELDYVFDSTTLGGFGDLDRRELEGYALINWIAGRQRTVQPLAGITADGAPDRMKPAFAIMTDQDASTLIEYTATGGKLLLSGAHVGEELFRDQAEGSPKQRLAVEVLGIDGYTIRPTGIRAIQAGADATAFKEMPTFRFGTDLDSRINMEQTVYPVPSTELLASPAAGELQYGEGGGACSMTDKAVLLAFPVEAVLPFEARGELVKRSIAHLLAR